MRRKNYWAWVAIFFLAIIRPASGAAVTLRPIACGVDYSLAIVADHSLWAWGSNTSAQLGMGFIGTQNLPIKVGNDHDWVAVSAGSFHSLGLKVDGTLWAWGDNGSGTAGPRPKLQYPLQRIPYQSVARHQWVAIAAGSNYSLGIKADGTLWAWGTNMYYQLGIGDNQNTQWVPTPVGAANDWIAVAAPNEGVHSLGLRAGDTLWAWGDNSHGEGGQGSSSTEPLHIPTKVTVTGVSKWGDIACGKNHCMAVGDFWFMYTWGANDLAQLGLGYTSAPIPTPTICGWALDIDNKRIPAGGYGHTMYFFNDSLLYGAGWNNAGQTRFKFYGRR